MSVRHTAVVPGKQRTRTRALTQVSVQQKVEVLSKQIGMRQGGSLKATVGR